MTQQNQPLSALAALKAMAQKKPAPVGSPAASLVTESNDPAIAGAQRNKSTVTLGVDPSIENAARECAELKAALNLAEAQFKVRQAELREYGAEKRSKYNDTFKCNVTTVAVPFTVEVPSDAESATPGREKRVVQVICSNKYSVSADTVLGLEKDLGDFFPRLFRKEEKKLLKPNAEDLIRNLLMELGISGEELETSMDALFEIQTKVSTTEAYEQEVKAAPEDIQSVLAQAVKRAAPGLKFPFV